MPPEYQYPITYLESLGSLGVCDNWINFKEQGQTRASLPKDLQPGKKDFKLGLLGEGEHPGVSGRAWMRGNKQVLISEYTRYKRCSRRKIVGMRNIRKIVGTRSLQSPKIYRRVRVKTEAGAFQRFIRKEWGNDHQYQHCLEIRKFLT